MSLIQTEELLLFINKLEIICSAKVSREINFHQGLNLIVDQTEPEMTVATGNGVGKTTVLRLIDFCLGKSPRKIYTDPESKKEITDVKNFLNQECVLIRLTLSNHVNQVDEGSKYVIERNFLSGKKKIQQINGKPYSNEKKFTAQIGQDLFQIKEGDKPSFRQVIRHSLRIDPPEVNNTLRYLGDYVTGTEYETLFLFLFGIKRIDRTPIVQKLNAEKLFLHRISERPLEQLTLERDKLIDDLKKTNCQRQQLNIDPDYSEKLKKLDQLKYKQTVVSNELSVNRLRKSLIEDAKRQIQSTKSQVDEDELKLMYTEAQELIPDLQTSFEELVNYNNKMIEERSRFIGRELPELTEKIDKKSHEEKNLEIQIKNIAQKLARSATNQELEDLSNKLGEYHEKKGRLDDQIEQIKKEQTKLDQVQKELDQADQDLFSKKVHNTIHKHVEEFNRYFSAISQRLYGEAMGVMFETKEDSKKKYYQFNVFCYNDSSSGKKQGEIAAFDLGYLEFARQNQIPVLDFLLYDKKELMHHNQLLKIAQIADRLKAQVIIPILADKLPSKLNNEGKVVLRLSQKDKLFRF